MPLSPNTPEPAPKHTVTADDFDFETIKGMARYRGSIPFDELPFPPVDPEAADEFNWADNDPQVRKDYGGLVVAVRHHKVWGAGELTEQPMSKL